MTFDTVTEVAAFGAGILTSSCVKKVAKAACENIIENAPDLFESEAAKEMAITLTGVAAGAAASYFVKKEVRDTTEIVKAVATSIGTIKEAIKKKKEEVKTEEPEPKPAIEAA